MRGAETGDPARSPRSPIALALLGLLALGAFAALIALGVWQLERRAWKLALIEQIETRVHAAPIAAPGPAEWPAVSAARDGYRRVTLTGTFQHDRETLVQAVTTRGSGFWVMTPMTTDAGFTVLINRGFVPAEKRAPASRATGQISGPASVTGLMRMSEPKGGFLRTNDAAADRWFSRDVPAIAAARQLPRTAPYFIDADATPNPGGYPIGGLTVLSFPNNHMSYALTWFALAALVAGAAIFVARYERRRRPA